MLLLVNDDGIHATGMQKLKEAVQGLEHLYMVVAPDSNCSGFSHALTLHRPLRAKELGPDEMALDGTPTDCVHLALNGLLKTEVERVVSGINRGPNMGDDALYSGTIAAAMEGRHLAKTALAFSLASFTPQYWDTAVAVVRKILADIGQLQLPARTVLNINIPDLPLDQIRGYQVVRLGRRHPADQIDEIVDPRGNKGYWIGLAGEPDDCHEGTDFYAVEQGYVALTPLCPDMTAHGVLPEVEQWLNKYVE